MCTKSGELACKAVDLEIWLAYTRILHRFSSAFQEYVQQLPALSRILNIALRRSRVSGVLADHLARGLTTPDAAFACGLSVLKVESLSVMGVLSWLRSMKLFVVVLVESVRFEGVWRGS